MSFPWNDLYAVVLEGWEAPDGFRVCAQIPFTEIRHAQGLEVFDTISLISESEYALLREAGPSRTVTYAPDAQNFKAAVHRMEIKPAAFERFINPDRPKPRPGIWQKLHDAARWILSIFHRR